MICSIVVLDVGVNTPEVVASAVTVVISVGVDAECVD